MVAYPGALNLEILPVTPFSQNCSLLWHGETRHAVVIDPGGEVPRLLAEIARHSLVVDAILLTHGHLDHAGGADALRAALTEKQGGVRVPVIGPDERDEFLLSGVAKAAAHFGFTDMHDVAVDRYTQHGEPLELLGHVFDVRHVPGHTPGHVVFIDHAARIVFAGDTLFRGTVGRTDFEYGDASGLVDAIKAQLMSLDDDFTVLPGHGAPTSIGAERAGNPFLNAG